MERSVIDVPDKANFSGLMHLTGNVYSVSGEQ